MVNWDDASQKLLLLVVVHCLNAGNPNWDQVANLMGEGYTASAVKQQFNKLRRDSKEQFGEVASSDGAAAAPKTPSKRAAMKANGEGSAKSTGKRKAKKAADEEQDDEESPVKKTKTEEAEDDEI